MTIRIQDAMIEREPIGLAESFEKTEGSFIAELETGDEAAPGEKIYFGMPLPIGEIAELSGEVSSCGSHGEGFLLSVKILEADAKLKGPALKALSAEAAQESAGGPTWAKGLKQMNGTYAFLVNAPAGVLSAVQLEGIARVAKRNAGVVKLTHAQRVVVLASADGMDSVEKELAELGLRVGVLHHGVRNIRACCGPLCKWCKDADAIKAAGELEKLLFGRETNFDVKIAISDCMRNCSESFCADIGALGGDGGYRLLIGGRGSQTPFRAIQLATGVKAENLPNAILKAVEWYLKTALPKERLWKTLERIGADKAAQSVAKISLPDLPSDGIDEAARLKAHIARVEGAAIAREELGLTAL